MASLSHRVVVVTGAAGRLGRLVASHLAAAGATVVAVDREAPEPPDGGAPAEGRWIAVAADVTSESGIREAFALAAEAGPVAGLVHTVGMWDGAPLAETGLDAWETLLRVNLTSTFLAFREAVRRMGAGGRLVAIASGQGADGGVAQQAAYSASKAGVIRLVEATADEYGPAGLAAVALAPSTLLFGGEPADARGIPAEAVAARCVELCGDAGAAANGQTIRLYGSAA